MTQTAASTDSYELTRFNALNHGILSRYTVLPWESLEEYRQLLAALVNEHAPQGPTEEHLVEEIAGIIWRKRRLRMGEAAIHRDRLKGTFSSFSDTAKSAVAHLGEIEHGESVADAIRATAADTAETMAEVDDTSATVTRAMEMLDAGANDAFQSALGALPEETQEWWNESIEPKSKARDEDGRRYTADAASLLRFLQDDVMPWLARYRVQLANRCLVREQAFGETMDPEKLERLGRYEVHLDRKLERMLAMLFRLKELRQQARTQES
jgi:hypothetical protein